jgi:hypothetical protein
MAAVSRPGGVLAGPGVAWEGRRSFTLWFGQETRAGRVRHTPGREHRREAPEHRPAGCSAQNPLDLRGFELLKILNNYSDQVPAGVLPILLPPLMYFFGKDVQVLHLFSRVKDSRENKGFSTLIHAEHRAEQRL